MLRNRISLIASSIVFVILFAVSASEAQPPNSSDISFAVAMPKPWTHLLEVEMRVNVPANLNVPNETDLVMPVWTPGSYLIREFERNVQDFAADVKLGGSVDASYRIVQLPSGNDQQKRIYESWLSGK